MYLHHNPGTARSGREKSAIKINLLTTSSTCRQPHAHLDSQLVVRTSGRPHKLAVTGHNVLVQALGGRIRLVLDLLSDDWYNSHHHHQQTQQEGARQRRRRWGQQ
ncbi:hypothetical protein C0Q70_20439 [Pomacea canaliculata]|uniref:Uncharacterized protein n=1 Tax=Pomacea canaliculata TaxID=400727 RepID=A0A2T7NFL9_POMCA|nr:hypothetical protein C0Q70_20439 [Pomacea canaliculata]